MNVKLKIGALIATGLIVIGLAISLAIGYAPEVVPESEQPLYATELTEAKRNELLISLKNWMGASVPELIPATNSSYRIARNLLAYYYGTYNGYDVIYNQGNMQSMWQLKLGDVVFRSNESATMYLHRNGEFIDLEQAYRDGLISDADLKTACEIHNQPK